MNYEVQIKQSKRPESEDSTVEIKKKHSGICRMAVWVFMEGKKRERRQKVEVKRWMERVQDRGIDGEGCVGVGGGGGAAVNNGWSVLRP